MRNLDNANIARAEKKQAKINYIVENYHTMERKDFIKVFMDKFECSKVSANKYVSAYEKENNIECKRGRSISDGMKKQKEYFKYIKENYSYENLENNLVIVNSLMNKFGIHRSKAYQVLKHYKRKTAEEYKEMKHKPIEKPVSKNKISIDDTDYFENSFNWNPKRRG